MQKQIKIILDDAKKFIALLPSDAVGFVFLDGNKPVQPDLTKLSRYKRHAGTRRGHWPSSPEIRNAMLERYSKPNP